MRKKFRVAYAEKHEDARASWEHTMRYAQQAGNEVYGLAYDDDLVSSAGIHVELFCNEQHLEHTEALNRCFAYVRTQRDVVSQSVTVIPTEWMEFNLEYPKS